MDKTVNAVLVGCGGISNTWLKAITQIPEVKLVGLVDIVRESAAARAAQYGLSEATIDTDLAAVLERTHPDVVFNCTIPEAHMGVTLQALAHGCHVLTEKPLADSMENARKIVAAAAQAQRIFAVIQNRRYNTQIRRLRHLIEAGTIGRLTTVNCDFYIGAHFGGFRDRMEHVLLLDMAIHTFDQARFITAANPRAVYCREWNPRGSWYDHDASAVAIFELSDDIVYTYRGSWCAEGLNTSWECAWRIIGEKGSIIWDGADRTEVQVVKKTGTFISELETLAPPEFDAGTKVGAHAGVIREFVRCVQSGAVPETVGVDNIHSLAMVFGAIESATCGQRVEIRS
jgi:predicted dehydrogenase